MLPESDDGQARSTSGEEAGEAEDGGGEAGAKGDGSMTRTAINRVATPIPVVLSALACGLVVSIAAGVKGDGDEGWQAHTWQILMAAQIPLTALFAATADRHQPKRIAAILALYLAAFAQLALLFGSRVCNYALAAAIEAAAQTLLAKAKPMPDGDYWMTSEWLAGRGS
jgi:hypothetical protein